MAWKSAAIVFLIFIFMVPLVSVAGVYHWVDSNGNVHFGDIPHDGAKPINVRVWKSAPHDDGGGHALTASQTSGADGKKMTPEQQCALARKQYRRYQSANQLVQVNQFGDKHTLDKSERKKVVARAKTNVGRYCSG